MGQRTIRKYNENTWSETLLIQNYISMCLIYINHHADTQKLEAFFDLLNIPNKKWSIHSRDCPQQTGSEFVVSVSNHFIRCAVWNLMCDVLWDVLWDVLSMCCVMCCVICCEICCEMCCVICCNICCWCAVWCALWCEICWSICYDVPGIECGIFVSMAAYCVVHNLPLDYSMATCNSFRLQMALRLFQQFFPQTIAPMVTYCACLSSCVTCGLFIYFVFSRVGITLMLNTQMTPCWTTSPDSTAELRVTMFMWHSPLPKVSAHR